MKFLKYLVFTILGLVVLFFAIGFIHPSVDYSHEITVDKPLKEAWAVSKDESKFAQWLAGFKSIELISGEQGAVGSKYKVIVVPSEGQPDFEMIETIESMKEFEEVVLSFDSDLMRFDQTISHSDTGGKSTIRTDNTVHAKGAMMRSMFAIMGMFGGFQKQEAKNLEALKKLINENTTNYYPDPTPPGAEEMMIEDEEMDEEEMEE